MDEIVWHSIPLHSSPTVGSLENVESKPDVEVNRADMGLQFTAEEMHGRFIKALDTDITLGQVRQTHTDLLRDDFGKIEATRRAVAMIPTMELLIANLDGTILGDIIRIPMQGVPADRIEIEVGMLGSEQIVRLAILGNAVIDRVARLGPERRLETAWFQGGELNLKTS